MNKIFAVIVNFHSDEKVALLTKTIQPAVAKAIVIDNNKSNRGFAGGVNLGIKQALEEQAESILLVNPDVEIIPKQIADLAETSGDIIGPILTFRRQNKKVFDFGGQASLLFGRTTHFESNSLTRPPLARLDKIDYVSGACVLIKSEVIKKIGLFDEKYFLYFEDADFCLRAKKAGFKIAVNTKVIVKHAISEQRYTKDSFKIQENLKSNWKFINKFVPWYFKPVAYGYLFLLTVKILFDFCAGRPK